MSTDEDCYQRNIPATGLADNLGILVQNVRPSQGSSPAQLQGLFSPDNVRTADTQPPRHDCAVQWQDQIRSTSVDASPMRHV